MSDGLRSVLTLTLVCVLRSVLTVTLVCVLWVCSYLVLRTGLQCDSTGHISLLGTVHQCRHLIGY